jgi:hypothetical protein
MSQIYIIGGGPGAGKSSVAETLSKKYHIPFWKTDNFVGEHQQVAADKKYPVNNYIASVNEDEQPLELIKLSANQELERQKELFFVLLKDLRKKEFDQVIIEGNCLLPDLVTERFEYPYRAVWIVPTEEFQRKTYPKRPWVPELLKQAEKPDLLLETWITRDKQYNDRVVEQAHARQLAYLEIDGHKPLGATIEWADRQLHFA